MSKVFKQIFWKIGVVLLLVVLTSGFFPLQDIKLLFAAAPTVTTGGASSITQTTATLSATIPSNGGKVITAGGFQYGTTTGYGGSVSGLVNYDFDSEVGTSSTGPSQFRFDHGNGVGGGIAVDSSDNVYVTDNSPSTAGNPGRIQIFDSSGTYLSEFGNCVNISTSEVCFPAGVSIDSSDNIIVSENDSNSGYADVKKFDSTYSYLDSLPSSSSWGSGEAEVNVPNDTTTDSSGNIYIADSGNNRIQKFDSSGTFVNMFGWGVDTGANNFEICTSSCEAGIAGSGDGQFDTPTDIAIDSGGNIYVVDSSNDRIQKFNSAGVYQSQFGTTGTGNGQFDTPKSLDFDSTGNIYVTDTENDRVQKFNSSGVYQSQFGTSGTGNGQFDTTNFIAIDSNDNVYVTDLGNNRVQKFNSSGTYVLQFGSPGADNGELLNPTGLAVDGSNNFFVIDGGNNRIQKFDSAGIYTLQFAPGGFGSFSNSSDLDVDSSGNIFVNEFGFACSIEEYNSSGVYQTSFGGVGCIGSAEGEFAFTNSVAINSSDDIYGSDGGRIQKFDSSNSFLSMFGWGVDTGANSFETCTSGCQAAIGGSGDGQFGGFFMYLNLDLSNNLYVSDNTNNRVQKFNSSGAFQLKFGTTGSGDGQFNGPRGVAVDSANDVFVVDTGNDRIQKFDDAGNYLLQFGSSGTDDGEFSNPVDIVVDSSDNVFVSDSINNVITKFTQQQFSSSVTGLGCNQTYHYRAFTTNADGTSYGSDMTFTTSNCSGGGGPTPTPECRDGEDNDEDGFTDYPDDDGCDDPNDNNEYTIPRCRDGIDNDSDGLTDWPADPGCENKNDNSETNPVTQCNDGIDNDGDGLIDYVGPYSLSMSQDGTEPVADLTSMFVLSSDGLSLTPQYNGDPDCDNYLDDDEGDPVEPPPPPVLGCTDVNALNYDVLATEDDGSCVYDSPPPPPPNNDIYGCMDVNATNYNPNATIHDSSCDFPPGIISGCTNPFATNYNPNANQNNGLCNFTPPPPIPEVISNIIHVVGNTIGNIIKAIPTAQAVPTVGLAIPLFFLLFRKGAIAQTIWLASRFWSLLPTLFGLKRKERPWGTVFDSVTKQPLDPVHVTLLGTDGQEVATSITDLDGRYGFLTKIGAYIMSAGKADYIFPSEKMKDKTKDELYDHLYFGEEINILKDDEIVARDIPMDAKNFNWNEFEKSKNKRLMKFFSETDLILAKFATIIFIFGLLFSVVALVYEQNFLNILIFALYILILILRILGVRPVAPGTITEKSSGTPMSFAIVRIFSALLNTEIAHTVAGKTGKYYTLIPKGTYYLKISKKTGEDSYEEVFTSEAFKARKGFIDKNFRV